MVEDIGNFKVVLSAEVDSKAGDALEKGFKKSGEKVGKNLQEEIEKAIDKSIEKARKFEKSFKIPSIGQIGEKLASFTSDTTKKVTATSLAPEVGTSGGGMMAMIGKLSIIAGVLTIIYDVLKSLSPIVALFKIMTAILQITLYPIAQFILNIFKPLLILIIKWLVIPFYTEILPILKKLGNVIGAIVTPENLLKGVVGPFAIIYDVYANHLDDVKNILSRTWMWITNIFNKIYDAIKTPLQIAIDWMKNTWNTILSYITPPLQTAIDWIKNTWNTIFDKITAPLDRVFGWIKDIKLPSWLGGGGGGDSGGGNGGGGGGCDTSTCYSSSGGDNTGTPGCYTPSPVCYDACDTSSCYTGCLTDCYGGNYMAEGGIVTKPTKAVIGEAGPEAVIPLPGFLKNLGQQSVNITFNIAKIEKSVDIDEITKKIERSLYVNMKRSGAR